MLAWIHKGTLDTTITLVKHVWEEQGRCRGHTGDKFRRLQMEDVGHMCRQ